MLKYAIAALTFALAQPAIAGTIKLTTWNMDWLTARPAGDPSLPADVGRRSESDFTRLASYARALNADVIGFQEVDGPEVAARIFPADRYRLILEPDAIVQRVGLAVRPDIAVTVNPEVTALNTYGPLAPHPLRGGLDVTLALGHARLRLLVVHLKTGCWDQPLEQHGHSCPTLLAQIRLINDWALEREDEGEPYAILGDFNRRLTSHDPVWGILTADAPMRLTTAGVASPCWGGEYFIDHILLGQNARNWLVPDSLRVMTYREGPELRDVLSDHCPVSVRLSLPE